MQEPAHSQEEAPVENVILNGVWYAVIIPGRYRQGGIRFFTPGEFSQQLGYMSHPAGHLIEPHVHRPVLRSVKRTEEVLVVRRGRVRVDFYDDGQRLAGSRVLAAGDVILLVQGGHGFEVLEACEMIEIKQGPYQGDDDKTRFSPRA